MKSIFLIIFLITVSFNIFAHEGGHGQPEIWTVNNQPFIGQFLKLDAHKVFFLNKGHKLVYYKLSELSPLHQKLVLERHRAIVGVNGLIHLQSQPSFWSKINPFVFSMGVLLLLAALWFLIRKNPGYALRFSITGCLLLCATACSSDDDASDPDASTTEVLANNISFLSSLFEQFSNVSTSYDDTYFYISSNGLPNHTMMVGITAWNEQVPIDQPYTGSNSWSIPIQPKLSDNPLSTASNFFKGAIAVAVNGVPIFNPLNNRGEDTNMIGELDQWGGHSGRADDYHYHLPPIHLESTVGTASPIAYALDGFPVYGETTKELDVYLGILNDDGSYQYHTIDSYPYFIASMRGLVNLDPNNTAPENQILPQAFTTPIRSDLDGQPQTVSITNFEKSGTTSYTMTYTQQDETYIINYGWDDNEIYSFEFVNPTETTSSTYQR